MRRIGALVKLSLLELWRRNDMFALLVLSLVLLVPLSMARPFGAPGATRYFDEVALLLVWGYSLFIALGIGGRLFTSEFANRTVYPLLAKPVSRGELLVGKFLGAVVASWSALAFFYALWATSSLLRGGECLTVCFFQAFVLHALFAALAACAVRGSRRGGGRGGVVPAHAFGKHDPSCYPLPGHVLLRATPSRLRRECLWRAAVACECLLLGCAACGVLRHAPTARTWLGRRGGRGVFGRGRLRRGLFGGAAVSRALSL